MAQEAQKKTILRVKRRLCDTEIPVLVIAEREKKRQRTVATNDLIDSFDKLSTKDDDSKHLSAISTAPDSVSKNSNLGFFDYDFEPKYERKQSVYRLVDSIKDERAFHSNEDFIKKFASKRENARYLQRQEARKERNRLKREKHSKILKQNRLSSSINDDNKDNNDLKFVASGLKLRQRHCDLNANNNSKKNSLCKDKKDESGKIEDNNNKSSMNDKERKQQAIENLKRRMKEKQQRNIKLQEMRPKTKILSKSEMAEYKRKIEKQSEIDKVKLEFFKKLNEQSMDTINDNNNNNNTENEETSFPSDWSFNVNNVTNSLTFNKSDGNNNNNSSNTDGLMSNQHNREQQPSNRGNEHNNDEHKDNRSERKNEDKQDRDGDNDDELEQDIDIIDLEYDPNTKTYKRVQNNNNNSSNNNTNNNNNNINAGSSANGIGRNGYVYDVYELTNNMNDNDKTSDNMAMDNDNTENNNNNNDSNNTAIKPGRKHVQYHLESAVEEALQLAMQGRLDKVFTMKQQDNGNGDNNNNTQQQLEQHKESMQLFNSKFRAKSDMTGNNNTNNNNDNRDVAESVLLHSEPQHMVRFLDFGHSSHESKPYYSSFADYYKSENNFDSNDFAFDPDNNNNSSNFDSSLMNDMGIRSEDRGGKLRYLNDDMYDPESEEHDYGDGFDDINENGNSFWNSDDSDDINNNNNNNKRNNQKWGNKNKGNNDNGNGGDIMGIEMGYDPEYDDMAMGNDSIMGMDNEDNDDNDNDEIMMMTGDIMSQGGKFGEMAFNGRNASKYYDYDRQEYVEFHNTSDFEEEMAMFHHSPNNNNNNNNNNNSNNASSNKNSNHHNGNLQQVDNNRKRRQLNSNNTNVSGSHGYDSRYNNLLSWTDFDSFGNNKSNTKK